MRFGLDTYGRYVVSRPHRERDRAAIEWYPYPSTWRRPAFIANIFIAPYVLAWHISRLTKIGWES